MAETQYASIGLKTHIWNNNFKSMALLAAFPVLIFAVVYTVMTASVWLDVSEKTSATPLGSIFADGLGGTLPLTPYILIGTGIWFCIAYLFHERMIKRMSHAHSVSRKDFPELYNSLENLCISRGITMPKLSLIHTDQLNAFASGLEESTYTITVTTGLIETLDKEEMEGVLAHELTHILNKDVRLLIVSIIFVGIFSTLLEMIGRRTFRVMGRSNKKNGAALILIAILALAVAYLLATLIRFAISRKREYLADAGAVELTKKPEALASALTKISGKPELEDMPDELNAMCIENPPGFFSIFATHPPIDKRIGILKAMS